ncbi:MAG: PorT family protein [Flavobacterium sp.]|nr:PorT family protein [Flavobacterium sp.]
MRNFLSLFTLLLALTIHAQPGTGMFGSEPLVNLENFDKQRVHWGYFLGFNSYDFKFDYIENEPDVLVETTIGFNVGLVGNLRLHEYVDLRFEPGLYYTQRNLIFPGFDNVLDARRDVKSTYIHFPLLLKFSSLRTGNLRPYLVGGMSTTLNLSSNSKTPDDNSQQRFRVKPWTSNYEIGFGIDLYFEYFKFSPSIRGVFGTGDELIRDNDPNSPWTSNIEKLSTRAVLINFTFH